MWHHTPCIYYSMRKEDISILIHGTHTIKVLYYHTVRAAYNNAYTRTSVTSANRFVCCPVL